MKVSIVNASNARLFRAVMRSFPPADRTVLTEWGPPDHALAFVREAMRQGTEGCVQDYRIFGEPWGFALEEIHVPVDIWEGADDNTGPPGYRAFLKRHIPQATVNVVPGEGHLSLLPHQAPAIFSSLLGGDHNAESTAGGTSGRRRALDARPARRAILQPAPVGDLDGRHDRRPDVELNLVVVAQRDVVRVAGVELAFLPGDVKNTVTLPVAGPTCVLLSGMPHSLKNWPRVKLSVVLGDSMWMIPSLACTCSQ